MQDLHSYFSEVPQSLGDMIPANPLQWGATLAQGMYSSEYWEEADIIIVACGESRGSTGEKLFSRGPEKVMEELFRMYNWHPDVKVAFAGFIRQGLRTEDSRAALRIVLEEFQAAGKIVIILGGSHDLTLQQYESYAKQGRIINATVADMLIDLEDTEEMNDTSFLMEMLTTQPNFIRNYSHIGFQSYFVHPRMLETLDKLRFDFYRLGKAREDMEAIEPVLRTSDMFSFDMSAIRYSDAPSNIAGSPNGFTGDEACMLTRYAGMSGKLSSIGIYGFDADHDQHSMTSRLIAQMVWYFIDGYYVRKNESGLQDRAEFIEFNVSFTDNNTVFLRSKRTGRWWMQLPDQSFVPCSYADYLQASANEIPERWLREQERLL